MEKYNVLKVDSLQDCFLVIANTYENPINDLLCDGDVSFIENGDVIFDLAVINGINFNRFIQVTVESHRLQAKTHKCINGVGMLEGVGEVFPDNNTATWRAPSGAIRNT